MDPWESTPLDGIKGGCSEARNVALRFWFADGSKLRVGGRSCIKFQQHQTTGKYRFWFVGIQREWDGDGRPVGTVESECDLPSPSEWILSNPRKMKSDNVRLRTITITFNNDNKLQLCFLINEFEDNGKHFIRALQRATTLRN